MIRLQEEMTNMPYNLFIGAILTGSIYYLMGTGTAILVGVTWVSSAILMLRPKW
jgi:hypothetical protein